MAQVKPAQQLSEARYYLGLSYATTAKLLSMERLELYRINRGEEDLSTKKRDRLQWLWQAAILWRDIFNPVHYPLRFLLLDKPLSTGQTVRQILLRQPHFNELTNMLTELRTLAQQHEKTLKQRRQQRNPSVYTTDQQRKIRLPLGNIVSF